MKGGKGHVFFPRGFTDLFPPFIYLLVCFKGMMRRESMNDRVFRERNLLNIVEISCGNSMRKS